MLSLKIRKIRIILKIQAPDAVLGVPKMLYNTFAFVAPVLAAFLQTTQTMQIKGGLFLRRGQR